MLENSSLRVNLRVRGLALFLVEPALLALKALLSAWRMVSLSFAKLKIWKKLL